MSQLKRFAVLPLLISSILLIFSACNVYQPIGYRSITLNVPLLNEQYELQSSFQLGGENIDIQTAFSPLNHLGIIGSLHDAPKLTVPTFELGAGYYKNLRNGFSLEAYGFFQNLSLRIKK